MKTNAYYPCLVGAKWINIDITTTPCPCLVFVSPLPHRIATWHFFTKNWLGLLNRDDGEYWTMLQQCWKFLERKKDTFSQNRCLFPPTLLLWEPQAWCSALWGRVKSLLDVEVAQDNFLEGFVETPFYPWGSRLGLASPNHPQWWSQLLLVLGSVYTDFRELQEYGSKEMLYPVTAVQLAFIKEHPWKAAAEHGFPLS